MSEGKSGPVSNRQVVSEVLSVTRHKTEMNRNFFVAQTLYKTKNAQGVCVVAAHIGRCWNDFSLKHSGSLMISRLYLTSRDYQLS